MTRITLAKVVLAVLGLLLFGYGVRADAASVRWTGIALVACAFLLRFVRRPPVA